MTYWRLQVQKLWQLIAISAHDAQRAEYIMAVTPQERARALEALELYEHQWKGWRLDAESDAA